MSKSVLTSTIIVYISLTDVDKKALAKVLDLYIELIIPKRCIRHLYRNFPALFFRKLPTYDK